MQYFKHAELVDRYHVSIRTVHNWIEASRQGRVSLELYEKGSFTYIAHTPGNLTILESLAEHGKKHRPSRFHKVATPRPEFYKLFSRKQMLDIISNLNIHREIPRQYNYFDGGAENWDRYTERRWQEDAPNLLKSTIELLDANTGAIDLLLGDYKYVNVIDLGPGNARPVKELLAHLLERGILHRYIAIDISEEMLNISRRNIEAWFGGKVPFEGYVKDITYERFDDLLVDDMLDNSAEQTINLALLLGATPMNFRSPQDCLKVVCSSLGHDDLLVYSDKPDTEEERRLFDFNANPNSKALSPNHRFIFDLLNIDESFYDVEMGFNAEKRVRYIRVRLKVALTIEFNFKKGKRSVKLEKGETILLWRAWHLSALEIINEFEKAGFSLLQFGMTKDRQYLLTISGINAQPELDS